MIPKRHMQEENVDSWLMSYADMITLLLCFFVIFVSVSEPKKEQLSAITNGMAGKFGTVDLSTPFESAYKALEVIVENHHMFKDFAIEKTETGVNIELSTGRFFAPDSADLLPDSADIIAEVAATLKKLDFLEYRISIESHTSDTPVKNPLFASNWELSSARGARMVRMLIDGGLAADHLKAVAYADTRPLVPNLDTSGKPIPENRHQNERIVITLERVK